MDGPVGSPESLSEVLPTQNRANLAVRHKPCFLVWQTVRCSKWLLGRNPLAPFFLNSVVKGWGVKVWDTKENADVFLKPLLFRKILFVFGRVFIPIRQLLQHFKVKSSRRGSLSSAKIQTVIIPLFLKWTLPALLFQGKGGVSCLPTFEISLMLLLPGAGCWEWRLKTLANFFQVLNVLLRCMLYTSKHRCLKADLFLHDLPASSVDANKLEVGWQAQPHLMGCGHISLLLKGLSSGLPWYWNCTSVLPSSLNTMLTIRISSIILLLIPERRHVKIWIMAMFW